MVNEYIIGQPQGRLQLRIAQISDCHLYASPALDLINWYSERGRGDVIASAQRVWEEVQSKTPDLILLTGDLIDYFSPENVRLASQVFVQPTAPCHFVFGNHDFFELQGPGEYVVSQRIGEMGDIWQRELSNSNRYYEFSLKGVQFLILDNSNAPPGTKELVWLDKTLNRANEPALIVGHWPLPLEEIREFIINRDGYEQLPEYLQPGSEAVIDILDAHTNVIAYISGHIHAATEVGHKHWKHITAAPAYHDDGWNLIKFLVL